MAIAIIRSVKLKGGQIKTSDEHTERARETLNADPQKLKNNIYLIGEPGVNLRESVDREIEKSTWTTKTGRKKKGKPRPDSVECIEFLMTASPEFFGTTEAEKLNKALELAEHAGKFMKNKEKCGLKFVKAVIHMDETTPHIVAYAVPFDPSGKLNAKHHFGGTKWRMAEYQDEYAEAMKPLGLERGIRGSTAKHQTIQSMYGKINHLAQLEEDKQLADRQAEEMGKMVEHLTKALSQQMENRSDIALQQAAKTFLSKDQLIDTSQGLAVLQNNTPDKLLAIVTPDNKAFTQNGSKISDGSSVQFLMQISGLPLEKVLSSIESKFDKETKQKAARAYGDELANQNNEITNRNFDIAKQEVAEKEQFIEVQEELLGWSMS